jgi:hypothetical protein
MKFRGLNALMRLPRPNSGLAMTLALWCACLVGCKDEPIVTYRIPKERSSAPGATATSETRAVLWQTPEGWREQAPSNLRLGSFLVVGKSGQTAEASVVALAGDGGGNLANVNRWRGQLELPPLSQQQLEQQSQTITPAGRRMILVDFSNDKIQKRLIASIHVRNGKTWFFKLVGDDATVREAKPAFLHFLESLRFSDHE